MDEVAIKIEPDDNTQSQCRACLSIGRKLIPIGKYVDIYKKLLLDYIYLNATSPDPEQLMLCWECHMQLRKASRFRQQVMKAHEIFQRGQYYMYGTLSCLTTVSMNDADRHTIYITEAIVQSDASNIKTTLQNDTAMTSQYCKIVTKGVKCDDAAKNQEDKDDLSDDFVNDNDVDVTNEISDVKIDKDEEGEENMKGDIDKNNIKDKKKTVSRWAVKRALQNKKPKFKILLPNELAIDKIFKMVHIGADQLKECLARERDSNSFRASKHKCVSCVAIFKNELLLMKHNNLWHNKNLGTYVCDICDVRMTKEELCKHIRKHYEKYECKFCYYLCSKKNLTNHLIQKHPKVFQCLKCELQFASRQDFFQHFRDWHQRFVCDHCGVSFKMRYCIKDHLKKQHSPFSCTVCGARFARYNGLWLHSKLRHSPPLPPAYCVECDKQYRDVYRYRWHLANSTRHKPKKKVKIPCPDCEKVFTKRVYMTNHHEYVHLKKFRFRCEECDKNFIRNADLVKHRRKVHEGIPVPRNKICYVCGKGFQTNKILSNHVRTHTGERPFACAACPARFAQRAALCGHARAMHPDRPP